MKRRLFIGLSLAFLALFVGISTSQAATTDIKTFSSAFTKDNQIEVMYAAKSGKLGIIIKDAKGEPIAAHMIQDVKNPVGKFDLKNAKKFGNVESISLESVQITKFKKNSVSLTVNGISYKLNSSDELAMIEAGLKCDNYCRPSDPSQYNWYLCFWCCATASGPCV